MFIEIDNVRRVDFDGEGSGMGDRHARPTKLPPTARSTAPTLMCKLSSTPVLTMRSFVALPVPNKSPCSPLMTPPRSQSFSRHPHLRTLSYRCEQRNGRRDG